ncbi:MAG: outer membrane lipoprotein-sorting protein [Spirochaetaceae bacterium]|nr:outer membrane lipoprotein-sorting protein [Spirochaetaceae bacterium]
MKKSLILTIFITLLSTLYAVDFHELLLKADALASYTESDFSAEYTIVHDKPGEGRDTTVAAIFRRDKIEQYVIIILEPDINRGQGYLKLEDTLWFYDPEGRRFNYSSSKDRFQNSNARNSDFTRSTLADDYIVRSGERVKLGNYDCWLLELEANNDEVTYPIMKIWISDDNLVRKTEDYSLSNQLLRTTAIPSYQKVGIRYIPALIYYFDALEGAVIDGKFVSEKTVISIKKTSFRDIPGNVFTKNFLERSAQ